MLRNVPTGVLVLGAVAISLLDFVLVGPNAIGAGDEVVETPAPITIPANAFLTGAVQSKAKLDGMEIEVLPAEAGRYLVKVTNPGPESREAAFRVDTFETSGLMIGRMGPMRAQVATEQIIASVPAKGTVTRTLEYAPVQPSANDRNLAVNDIELAALEFNTTEFAIALDVEAAEGVSPAVAMLRLPETRASEGVN
jgi:hypothetical protein